MKIKINVTTWPKHIGIEVKHPDGSGVSFTLTHRAAVELADKLNAVLDDPSDKP